MAVYRDVQDDISVDTLYVLSIPKNNQVINCWDTIEEDYINFDATSSKTDISSLQKLTDNEYSVIPGNTGKAKISIVAEDGRKTWFNVIVVDDADDMPDFVKEGVS